MTDPEPLPRLVRLYVRQCLIGFALSGVFTVLLLVFDVAGLRGLIASTQGGYIALFLLFFFNGLVFAGVQFAIAIMRMGDDDDDTPHGGRHAAPMMDGGAVPIRIAQRQAGQGGGPAATVTGVNFPRA